MNQLLGMIVLGLLGGALLSAFQINHEQKSPTTKNKIEYYSIRYGDGYSVHCATVDTNYSCGAHLFNCTDPATEIYCAKDVRVEK